MKVTEKVYLATKKALKHPWHTQATIGNKLGLSCATISRINTSENYEDLRVQVKLKNIRQNTRKEQRDNERALTSHQSFPEWAEQDIKRIKTKIKGHLRDIYSLLKQL